MKDKVSKGHSDDVGTEESLEFSFVSHSLSPSFLPKAFTEHALCAWPLLGAWDQGPVSTHQGAGDQSD